MASHATPRPATKEKKTEEAQLKEERDIREYRGLVDLIDVKIKERQYTREVLELTSKMLKKNPEYYTIWNLRRRVLIHDLLEDSLNAPISADERQENSNDLTTSSTTEQPADDVKAPPPSRSRKSGTNLDIIQADLDFILPLMIGWPKCYWIWNYRLWLLDEGNRRLHISEARDLWLRELGFVSKMLTKDRRNFHGWGYRRKVIAELESEKLLGQSMVESEFEYSTRMINVDLKNFSAWHNRSKLIPRLLNERHADEAARRQFLDNEFDLITKAIYTDQYPYDQSVWFYHQFLMTTLTDSAAYTLITPSFTDGDRLQYLHSQIANLKDFLDGGEDCKWAYNALIDAVLAVCQRADRSPTPAETQDLRSWLAEVRSLDPQRKGRWDDLESSLFTCF